MANHRSRRTQPSTKKHHLVCYRQVGRTRCGRAWIQWLREGAILLLRAGDDPAQTTCLACRRSR